jgi:hypothetical protein
MKILRWAGAGLFILIAALAFSARPGTLSIKFVNTPWTAVTLSSDHAAPVAFSPGSTPRLWPIRYGPYKISITFPDGRTVWLTYFHYDAGVRKRAEVTVERLPDGETVRITQTYNESDKDKVEGTVSISKTSADKPFLLDGPA